MEPSRDPMPPDDADHKHGKRWLGTQQESISIDWTPSRRRCSIAKIPSLLDLSVNVLVKNAGYIVSLPPIPDALKHIISQAACDHRKMDGRLLEMLVNDSPTVVYVKDCSWMAEEHFIHIFRSFNSKSLMVSIFCYQNSFCFMFSARSNTVVQVDCRKQNSKHSEGILQLDLCSKALTDYTLGTTLAQSNNGLPALASLSLKSTCRLTDDGLASIVESAPLLRSINLSQCSLLTSCGVSKLAGCLGSILKELYIDDCPNIDPMEILPALAKFECLEVLSVSGIHTASDEFVRQFICSCGSKLKEISLANCQKLTDNSLRAVCKACPELCALDISYLDQLTDATVKYIANGCRSIQRLKCCRNSFSDEAIASFLEVSGQSLKELSLNHISKVGSYTALSLAKHSRSLVNLDLSWCRNLSDAAVGHVVHSCLSLRLLKLFGCTQITEVFLNGHSNPNVEIIGLNNLPLLKQLGGVETHPGALRYSPLVTEELS